MKRPLPILSVPVLAAALVGCTGPGVVYEGSVFQTLEQEGRSVAVRAERGDAIAELFDLPRAVTIDRHAGGEQERATASIDLVHSVTLREEGSLTNWGRITEPWVEWIRAHGHPDFDPATESIEKVSFELTWIDGSGGEMRTHWEHMNENPLYDSDRGTTRSLDVTDAMAGLARPPAEVVIGLDRVDVRDIPEEDDDEDEE